MKWDMQGLHVLVGLEVKELLTLKWDMQGLHVLVGLEVKELLTLKLDMQGLHVFVGLEVNELLAFKFVPCTVGDGNHQTIYIQICPKYCWGWKSSDYLHSNLSHVLLGVEVNELFTCIQVGHEVLGMKVNDFTFKWDMKCWG